MATKRVLRAILKSAGMGALEPDRVARFVVDRSFVPNYDYTLQIVEEIGDPAVAATQPRGDDPSSEDSPYWKPGGYALGH